MKQPKFIKLFSFLFFIAFVPFANGQEAEGQADQHMLWKVSNEQGLQGYLVGSIHLMKPGIYPLDEVYQSAFKKSEVVVFELNFDSLMVNAMGLMRRLAIYPSGKSIKDALSTDTYMLLKNTLDSLGLPVARFNRMEPWLAAITVPSVQIRQAGYTGKSGIDWHFFSKAKKAGREIKALETAAYQFGLFDNLSPALQEKYLTYSLKHADETLQNIDEMASAWQHGNAEKIEQIMQGKMKENFPELYHTLLIERNKNWVPKIEKLLASGDTPLIIVGAGHMVGSKGLILLLEERGYRVEQL